MTPTQTAPANTELHPSIIDLIDTYKTIENKLRSMPSVLRFEPRLLAAHNSVGSYLTPRRQDGKDIPDSAKPLIE